ncbi:MAG: DnaT-like ssDNA-binding domain-containing protein [Aeromonas sp.]
MTPAEYHALGVPYLSHPARTLYCLQLRRLWQEQQPLCLDYPALGRALAVSDRQQGGFSFQVNARQLTALLQELIAAELVVVTAAEAPSEHYHGCSFQLPLIERQARAPLPERPFAMHLHWRPDAQLPALAKLCGVLEARFSEEDLGEFIAYWLGRPEVFESQHQWQLRFIRALKGRRYVKKAPTAVVGFQHVAAAPSPTGPSDRARQMIAEAKKHTHKSD